MAMIDFSKYSPEELTLLAYDLALILAKDRSVSELAVMSSMLNSISDIIGLIAIQKDNLESLRKSAEENELF